MSVFGLTCWRIIGKRARVRICSSLSGVLLRPERPDLIEKLSAIHRNSFFPALIAQHFLVIGHPANAERHQPLVELHAIGHRGAGVEFVVSQAADQLDHAFAFMEVVDHRRGRHAQNVQIRVAFGGKSRERRHQLPSLGNVLDGALLRIVDFIHNDEVNRFALDKRPDPIGRVRLLERLVVENQVAVGNRLSLFLCGRRPG